MQIVKSRLVLLATLSAVLAGVWFSAPVQAAKQEQTQTTATPQAGVQITPATLTLSLAKGESQQSAEFSLTNHYAAPVTLNFSFGQTVATPGAKLSATKQLRTSPATVTIQPGATVNQSVVFTDSKDLAPGSQQVELIISQTPGASGNVSIIPSVRMPLVTIKQDGAFAALAASDINKPTFAFDIPKDASFKIENTGNITTIPRGFVTVTDPRGRVASRGVINTASVAIAPGGELRMSTPLTTLQNAIAPGLYKVQVSYGLGGGQAPKIATVQFFYFPMWQLALLLLAIAMVVTGRLIWKEWTKLQRLQKTRPPAETEGLSTGGGLA